MRATVSFVVTVAVLSGVLWLLLKTLKLNARSAANQGWYVLAGFASEKSYTARRPDWEPDETYAELWQAKHAATAWRGNHGAAAQVEIIRLGLDTGTVVALVTQDGTEKIG